MSKDIKSVIAELNSLQDFEISANNPNEDTVLIVAKELDYLLIKKIRMIFYENDIKFKTLDLVPFSNNKILWLVQICQEGSLE